MDDKREIKKHLVQLRGRGCIVWNFNNNRANNAGTEGMPDWIILTRSGNIVFVEVKRESTKDDFSEVQKEVKLRLEKIMLKPHSSVFYYVVKNAKDSEHLQTKILKGEL